MHDPLKKNQTKCVKNYQITIVSNYRGMLNIEIQKAQIILG